MLNNYYRIVYYFLSKVDSIVCFIITSVLMLRRKGSWRGKLSREIGVDESKKNMTGVRSENRKANVFEFFVRSVLTYGSETWPVKKR